MFYGSSGVCPDCFGFDFDKASNGYLDMLGVPGQGNDDPFSVFPAHQLVKYNSKIYDPSYGTGDFTWQEYQDLSFAGFERNCCGGSMATPKEIGVDEVREY